jgi:hypothetical protein
VSQLKSEGLDVSSPYHAARPVPRGPGQSVATWHPPNNRSLIDWERSLQKTTFAGSFRPSALKPGPSRTILHSATPLVTDEVLEGMAAGVGSLHIIYLHHGLPCFCSMFVQRFRMADSTQIEWTDSTWNPVTGCSKITAGCDFCYAERFSERFRGVDGHPFENGFDLTLRPARLAQPLQWNSRDASS